MKINKKFIIRSVSQNNDPCKTVFFITDDGSVHINVLTLTDKDEMAFHKKLCSKFGKSLFLRVFGFKYSTLNTIHDIVTKELSTGVISLDDIL